MKTLFGAVAFSLLAMSTAAQAADKGSKEEAVDLDLHGSLLEIGSFHSRTPLLSTAEHPLTCG